MIQFWKLPVGVVDKSYRDVWCGGGLLKLLHYDFGLL